MRVTEADHVEHVSAFLRARWANFQCEILKPIFGLIAEGEPVPLERICDSTGCTIEQVGQAVADGPVVLNSDNKVISIFGFGFRPALHEVRIGDVQMYVCCALWSHFLALLTDRSVVVISVDTIDGSSITVHLRPDGIHSFSPESASATLINPRVVKPNDSVGLGERFCSHNLHFANRLNAEAYVADHPDRVVVSMNEIHQLSLELAADVWK